MSSSGSSSSSMRGVAEPPPYGGPPSGSQRVTGSKAAEAAASGAGARAGAGAGVGMGASASAGAGVELDVFRPVHATKGPTESLSFIEQLPDSKHFLRLRDSEDLFEALSRLDPELVSSFRGRQRLYKRKRVPPGHVGLGDNSSRTLFFRPGAYTRIGYGRKLSKQAVVPMPGPGERLTHGDVTYMHVRDDQVAVVQIGTEEHICGAGRFIIRTPNHLVGEIVTLRAPGKTDMKRIICESSVLRGNELIDEQTEGSEAAGSVATVGSIQFLRAEPGYVWAVQGGGGSVRTGEGVTAIRADEKFIDWLSIQRTTRTTDVKKYPTADALEAFIKLQLQWRLFDGGLWIAQCRHFDDPFDYFEEKLDALVQDEIGRSCMRELEDQRLTKFDGFEGSVSTPLRDEARKVGVHLLSMEVRHLRFPVQDDHKRQQQVLEADAIRAQREREYQAVLARQAQAQQLEAANAELAKEQNNARRAAEIAAIRDERSLAQVDAEAAQSKRQMEAAQVRLRIESETKLMQAENDAAISVVERERRAEAALRIARLEAEAEFVRAESQARAAAEMARVLRENPEYLRYMELEMQTKLEEKRIAAIAAFAANPNAILPPSLQRDVLRMNYGYDPSDYAQYMPGTHGGSVPGATPGDVPATFGLAPRPRKSTSRE